MAAGLDAASEAAPPRGVGMAADLEVVPLAAALASVN